MYIHIHPFAATKKMQSKMSSAEVVCCMSILTLMTNFGMQTNSVDPDQTAPKKEPSDLAPHCLL